MKTLEQLTAALTGRYEVEYEIGRGGMATVYLARDLRHQRPVALKVLNPELGAILGAERFLAEIQVTANLQHPNLLPLFDSGEADGLLFYVMPYVTGESLRARLVREKQLPVDEAIGITVAVASALDHAHRRGVVHRDLKPENVLLHEGQPLVADFGIALAVSNAGGHRITQSGLSLGTPQYMSPEQATGDRPIDGRTDIYSLGAVLYEMLVGDPPHLGSTAQTIIAKVLTERPQRVRAYRPSVPPQVEACVERALEKLPADRFATAREFADALRGRSSLITTGLSHDLPADGAAPALPALTPAGRRYAVGAALVLAGVLAGAGAAARWEGRRDTLPAVPVRFTVDADVEAAYGTPFALSPDGTLLAYVGGSSRTLYLRRMDGLAAQPLPGTEDAHSPAFSPDGKWVAYHAGRQLKKVNVDGGAPVILCNLDEADGVAWDVGERIVVASKGSVYYVSSAGGTPVLVAAPDSARGEARLRWPHVLRDGKSVVVVAGSREDARSHFDVVSLDGKRRAVLPLDGVNVLGMVDDYLLYVDGRSLVAVPFDLRAWRVRGERVPVMDGIVLGGSSGVKAAISQRGSLVYQIGTEKTQLSLIRPGTAPTPIAAEARPFGFPRYSPDGRRIAVTIGEVGEEESNVWLYDLASHTLQRLTTGGAARPEWTADGRSVIFRRFVRDRDELWWQPADGSAAARPLIVGPYRTPEGVVSPDGQYLAYRIIHPVTRRDIWYRRLSGDTSSHPLVTTDADDLMPRFSPDGRWLAYASESSGRREVYVRPFPGPGGSSQLSAGGGDEPLWSRDGKQVYYRVGRQFMAATLAFEGDGVRVQSRATLFEGVYSLGNVHASWDVAPDGRFLVLQPLEQGPQVVVAHDWRTELLARLHASR